MLTFSLQSGSNGNCIYVEAGGVRLLFDAGLSGRQTRLRLAAYDRDVHTVDGVVLSHWHNDHTRCAGVLHRLFKLPIYATAATCEIMAPTVGEISDVRIFQPGDTLSFGPLRVYTLPTPHDADESVAFLIECEGRRLGLFTDLGHPFPALTEALSNVHAAYLESNYDPEMAETGWYPPEVKARIRGGAGHLSNGQAAELLRRHLPKPRWVALAHLSENNNDPALALETHRRVLGRDYPLTLAGRYGISELLSV